MDNIIQFPISHQATAHELSGIFEQIIKEAGLSEAQVQEFMGIFSPILSEFDFSNNIELTVSAPAGSTVSHNLDEVNSAFGKHLAHLICERFKRELDIYLERLCRE
jgi:hypothetical protein